MARTKRYSNKKRARAAALKFWQKCALGRYRKRAWNKPSFKEVEVRS